MLKVLPSNKTIEILFWLSATLFIALLPYTSSVLTSLLKIVPIAMLAILVLRADGDWKKNGILAALIFSATGDIFMETSSFVLGLSAFLIAHICYLIVFCRHLTLQPLRLLLALTIISSTAISAQVLAPNLGELAIAVYVYISVIAVMAIAASLGAMHHPAVILGAIVFMISDSLIAFNRFDAPIDGARYAIMFTYYLAQFLLTTDARAGRYQKV